MCVKKTRRKLNKVRKLGRHSKLLYSGADERNEVRMLSGQGIKGKENSAETDQNGARGDTSWRMGDREEYFLRDKS